MSKTKGAVTLKVFFLIVMTDVLESIAELFFKKGALATGIDNVTLSNFLDYTFKIICVPNLWGGVAFYAMNFVVWIVVLSRVELSVAFPIGSTTYIIVPLLSMIFLHEKVFFLRWIGIILIILGIYFVSKSSKVTHIH